MALLGTNRDTGFDIKLLAQINEIFEKEVMPKYKHLLDDSKMSIIDINVLLHQTPGGMLSNLVNQLREMDALDKIGEVYKELPRVRKDLGQIPLVTPTSQIVGIQTVNNVLFDTPEERYKMITGQVKDLCYGLYGKTAVPINEEVQKKALKGYERGEDPITCRPAEVLEPELDKAKEEIGDLAVDMDDLVLYAIYPVTGKKFLKWKYGKEEAPDSVKPITMQEVKAKDELIKKAKAGELVEKKKDAPAKGATTRTFNVFVDNEYFEVGVDEVGGSPILKNIQQIQVSGAASAAPATPFAPPAPTAPAVPAAPAAPAAAPAAPAPAAAAAPKADAAPAPAAASDAEGTPLPAPMPGMIVKYEKNVGDTVNQGETVVILEAMKMENALSAPASGTIKAINFGSGDSVGKGDVLCVIG
jgi:oxaloacetate decarboxylase alpha subunit/pyruvate carboxylase subunit B